jgi:hypothetical protein
MCTGAAISGDVWVIFDAILNRCLLLLVRLNQEFLLSWKVINKALGKIAIRCRRCRTEADSSA